MEFNPARMCELLVGLPVVSVLAVDDDSDGPVRVVVESRVDQGWCRACGCRAVVKDRPTAELVDLPCFGRRARLVWRKAAWREAPWFSDAERAALALTEAVTRLADRPESATDEIWDAAAKNYDEAQLGGLLVDIGAINVWNRLNVVTRAPAGA